MKYCGQVTDRSWCQASGYGRYIYAVSNGVEVVVERTKRGLYCDLWLAGKIGEEIYHFPLGEISYIKRLWRDR